MVTASTPYVPDRGDFVWLTFDPQSGHEQAGRRPALILSPIEYNRRTGLSVVCPITNRSKGYPFEVPIPDGLPLTGVVLADQIKSLDWRTRRAELACQAPDVVVLRTAELATQLIQPSD